MTRSDILDLETRLGARIDKLGARLDGLGARIDGIDPQIRPLRNHIDQVETSLGGRMDEFNRRLDRFFLTMVTGPFAMVAILIAAVFII